MTSIFTIRTECPVCSAVGAKTIFSAPLLDPNVRLYVERKIGDPDVLERFNGTPYTLLKCTCGLIYQQHILSDEYLSTMYDKWVVHREAISQSAAFLPYYANELYSIASLFQKPLHEIKVLDYGLGAGKWAKVANAIGFEIYGTDLAQNLLDDATRQGIRALAITEIDRYKFDFINTEQVFEHLARPQETLSRLIKCLAPKGIIKISVPDGKNIERLLPKMDWSARRGSKRYLVPVTPLVHINTFTDDVIEHMGKLRGLSRVRPRLRNEYSVLDCTSVKKLAKSLIRPIHRRLNGTTYVFLQKNGVVADN